MSSKEALKELTRHFTGGQSRGPAGHAWFVSFYTMAGLCAQISHSSVVLMDELDQMVTPKQDVIYNFFNWPTLVESKLVVIAVANTMDLPERHLNARVRSRLGMTRINFQPYKKEQLQTIVKARLESARKTLETEEDQQQVVLAEDAIKLASAKVGGVSGDARRVLDVCRLVSSSFVFPLSLAKKTLQTRSGTRPSTTTSSPDA